MIFFANMKRGTFKIYCYYFDKTMNRSNKIPHHMSNNN